MPESHVYGRLKGGLDFVLAGTLLLLASPVVLLAAALVKLTSRGPAFYSQARLGRHGRVFRIYKLRTMVHNCERQSGPRWCLPRDARVTPLGRFLRRTHLDELPQLWNILRGEMSLVGPRPERPEFLPMLEKAIPHYRDRLLVRPGLTGLAQVQLPPDTDVASVKRKLVYDLAYVRQVSFWLDVRILLATGLYLLRIPATFLRTLFRIPAYETVESAYRQLLSQGVSRSHKPGAESFPVSDPATC
ncbi:MAG: sugar transferase [Planctomycetes bacterium]|nr:sugar transferase [Planctomycetota bacterium]